ncbi:MAG TPA: serine/threonine-protein kinase, partial [Haliangium sp.]|nr:serine/threonine-protein kinase [Haliangium sp.]
RPLMDPTTPSASIALNRESLVDIGHRVGEYEIEAKIGEGGFGSVFRAVHPVIGKVVAIKVLHRRYSAQPEMVRRFVAEARAVNQIRHRNIIDIFAFGQLEDGRHYYVMEYLEGATLEQHITQGGPMGLAESIPILRRLARALDAAHAKGIAHRDLKPDNVFMAVDEDGGCQPKLLDFGIAKLLAEEAPEKFKTRTGAPIGTPQYMSPEQCRGRGVDHRTDIYGFGIIAYRMLTGVLPFDGEDYMEILLAHLQQEPRPPSTIVSNLPDGVDEAIHWMLQKDPAERPPNLATAVRSLETAAEAAGIPLPRASLVARALVVGSSPVPIQGTPPVDLAMIESISDEDGASLQSLASNTARMRQQSAYGDRDSRVRLAPPGEMRFQSHADGQSGSLRSMGDARQISAALRAASPGEAQGVRETPRAGRPLLKLVLVACGLAGAVMAGVTVNWLVSAADAGATADLQAPAATDPPAGEREPAVVTASGSAASDSVSGARNPAGATEPGAVADDAGALDQAAQRFVTVTIDGPPANTEVYGPQGLLGVAPGKIQLVRGQEPVMLTFKAEAHQPETREVVPTEDRAMLVELDRKPRARPAPRQGGRKDKKRRERDTIEDPFQ